MPSLRDIRRRITSVKNTRQITRAMKLVSGAKLKRATDAAIAARPYQRTLSRVLARVVASAGDVEHPLLTQPSNTQDVLVVLLTADRGLCGAFNQNICRAAQEQIDKIVADGKTVRLVCYGKKGRAYFEKRGYNVAESFPGMNPTSYARFADELSVKLVTWLNANNFSAAYLAYGEFRSVMSQKPSFQQVLPMKLESAESAAGAGGDYLYEPRGQEILAELLPMALRTQLFQAFLETEAGEQASRMTAMDNATRNASELIASLTLDYNRARQAYITKELIEIVSGAEAL